MASNAAVRAAKLRVPCRQAQLMLAHDQLDAAAWRWYRFFWVWSAFRLSDLDNANARQHRTILALGVDGLERRFQRVRQMMATVA